MTASTGEPGFDSQPKDIAAWRAQLRKGAAELAVLAVLAKGESYGARLLDVVGRHPGLALSEGWIYPLLLRMQKEGTISSRWVEDPGATHPRKYYRVTPAGVQALEIMLPEWRVFADAMAALLSESAGVEQNEQR